MKHISDDELLQHISDAVTEITPDNAEELWNQPITPADGSEWYLDSSDKIHHNRKKKVYFSGAIAACLLLCLVSTFMFRTMPSASIYLDVNPSILLKVNYKNRVTEAKACNEDAEKILQDLDLKGTDLDVAVYAVLGSLIYNNYLSEAKDTVLVSVQSSNPNRASELETLVSDLITTDLEDMLQTSDVLTNQLEEDDINSDQDSNDYTPGKDSFIENLLQKYPELQNYPLYDMTMDEIVSLLDEKDLDYSEYKEYKDEGDDDYDDDYNYDYDYDDDYDDDYDTDDIDDIDNDIDEDDD